MKYEKISLNWPFNVGSFLNAKLGLEAALEEGDDLVECYKKVSAQAKALAAYEQGSNLSEMEKRWLHATSEIAQQTPLPPLAGTMEGKTKPTEEDTIEAIRQDILTAENLKVLESYKFIVKKYPTLALTYDEMHDKLKNKSLA